ncbi:hypothetical protein FACS1894123_06700 [Bacteroidia bacterium]|nr:hypothetical protein FACS1894123_06700 [Bacteroidia bacterium]
MDSTHILIGQQTKIHLEIAANKGQQLQIPFHADTLITGVEVLAISKPDTIDIGNNRMQLKYDYLITSFDSAVYLLPPFVAIAGADTAYSGELGLKVSTLPVDTESGQFYDIKGIVDPRFVLSDYLPVILSILGGVLAILLAIFLIKRWRSRKSLIPFVKEKPDLPPHLRAINGLDEVKLRKLWQQGKVKEYHSEVTDILRQYIDERFAIGAMEMTSGEILDKIKGQSDVDTSIDNLKQILLLADFVKFAKYNPLPDENELSLMNAYLFVNNTQKEEIQPEEEKKKEKENNPETETPSRPDSDSKTLGI